METIDEYSHRAQVYEGEIPSLARRLVQNVPAGGRVLDVGCGDGSLLDALAGQRKDLELAGVDISPERLSFLRSARPSIHAEVDDAQTLATVADASIDVLLSSQVIEHVDDLRMLGSVHRVLKPGGRAYLSTVWKKEWAWYFHRAGDKWALDPTHLREYTLDEQLIGLVRDVGLRCESEMKTPIAYPLIDPIVRRAFRGKRLPGVLSALRKVRVPILGFYLWELVLHKPS